MGPASRTPEPFPFETPRTRSSPSINSDAADLFRLSPGTGKSLIVLTGSADVESGATIAGRTIGAMVDELPDYAVENRRYWDGMADKWVAAGEQRWAAPEPIWGAWGVADDQVPLLPDDLDGRDVIELGCGTAYVSAWALRRGARRVVGIDNSARQLQTARRLADRHAVDLTLHHGVAERTPEPDASFDVAISEYGAVLWAEPLAFLSEARRLLRDGGALSLLTSHPLAVLTAPLDGSVPSGTQLLRPWFGEHRYDWRDAVDLPGGIEFVPTVGQWFALAHRTGFRIDDYREIQPPATADDGQHFAVTGAWAKRWPAEHALWLTAC